MPYLKNPRLEIDLGKITFNAEKVVKLCDNVGIEVIGVTKGFAAIPAIVKAMMAGGIKKLADARLYNIMNLRKFGFTNEILLLRLPRLSTVKQTVLYADYSLNSEKTVIKALSSVARKFNKTHGIIIMVDVGDLREGIMPEYVVRTIKDIVNLKGIKLLGLGTNVGCYGGILPSSKNFNILVELKKDLYKEGIDIPVLSGGGTSSLQLIKDKTMPDNINQLRIGEGILLGRDSTRNKTIEGLYQDTFVLKAEVIEIKEKPSVPIGKIGRDAFGHIPKFKDRGIHKRAIAAIGKQDIRVSSILPMNKDVKILGASSDHLILDVDDVSTDIKIGDEMSFSILYPALLSAVTSQFVYKHYI